MTLETVRTWWPILWAGLSTLGMLLLALMSRTYAKKEEVEDVKREVGELKTKVDAAPTSEDINRLALQLAEMRGDLKEHRAALEPVNHLSKLLLEDRLNED